MRDRRLLYGFLIFVGFYVLYFAGLGGYPLVDPDEPIYGQFVKEMVAGGDWLTPHYKGELWFDKPPLFYWLAGPAVKLLGLTELAIRLPSAVFALATVLMVFLLASYDFGKRAGMLSAAVMATGLLQIVMSHAAATDTIFVFLLVAALYAFRRWLDCEGLRDRVGWMLLCGAAAGFGMLAKGPVAPMLLFVTFAVYLGWTRQLRRLAGLDTLVGVLAALVIGLPWYIAMYEMHGHEFMQGFIVTNNITRFLKPLHKSETGQWYSHFRNIPLLLGLLFPWSVFLPQALGRMWNANKGSRLAVLWFAIVFVFFSLSKTQNFTYTLPVFPACAMLIGALWQLAESGDKRAARSVVRGLWVGLVGSVLIAAALVILVGKTFPGAKTPALVMAGALVGAFAFSLIWVRFRGDRITGAVWIATAGMVLFTAALMFGAMPLVGEAKAARAVAERIHWTPETRVIVYNMWRPGYTYYLKRPGLETGDLRVIARMMAEKSPTVIVSKKSDVGLLKDIPSIKLFEQGEMVVFANRTTRPQTAR